MPKKTVFVDPFGGHHELKPLSPLASHAAVESERFKLGVFARQVEAMRNAQREYFKLSALAKRTKHADDFSAAKTMLSRAKDIEAIVDKAVSVILNPGKEEQHA